MGMAASQARYLALVARKSNCEYEGQQINQARLNLSNESANLFNQMLGLSVPVPPSTTDFTTTQYSFTDGLNGSVLDSWKQLSESDPEYNYIVKTHSFADVYTGSIKKMADPQVQISTGTGGIASRSTIENAINAMRAADNEQQVKLRALQAKQQEIDEKITDLRNTAQRYNSYNPVNTAIINFAPLAAAATPNGYLTATWDDGATHYNMTKLDITDLSSVTDLTTANMILKQVRNMVDLGIVNLETVQAQIMEQNPSYWVENAEDIYSSDVSSTADFNAAQLAILDTYILCEGDEHDTTAGAFNDKFLLTQKGFNNVQNAAPSSTNPVAFAGYQFQGVTGNPFYTNTTTTTPSSGTPSDTYTYTHTGDYVQRVHVVDDGTSGITTTVDRFRDLNLYQSEIADLEAEIAPYESAYQAAHNAYLQAEAHYNETVKPMYIGNSELTLLTELTDDQETELKQVIKDLTAQGVDTALLNGTYFDENGNYLGGIYSFELNGNTYYTTYTDLCNAYASNQLSNNYIDAQYKMPYFNATYVKTRLEQEGKALLETDGDGRFKTIRFENDSVTYTLNMEQITDDAAYNDAMNRYYYENARYDKMIQDINAKTSIIHQQDQELELRLKQLDTEQNALSNEIDAVSKVVKDNVEASFKTFGG